MHGATHAAWGAAVGLGAARLTGAADPPALVAAALIGGLAGLAPDWLQINVPGANAQLKGVFGHRGFSHWIWTPVAMSLLINSSSALNINSLFWPVAAFFSAWASHILLDVFADGAPVFWPFGRLTWGHVKTGGKIDRFCGGAALVWLGLQIITLIGGYYG